MSITGSLFSSFDFFLFILCLLPAISLRFKKLILGMPAKGFPELLPFFFVSFESSSCPLSAFSFADAPAAPVFSPEPSVLFVFPKGIFPMPFNILLNSDRFMASKVFCIQSEHTHIFPGIVTIFPALLSGLLHI